METDVLAVPRQRGDAEQLADSPDAAARTSAPQSRVGERLEVVAYVAVIGTWGLYVLRGGGGCAEQDHAKAPLVLVPPAKRLAEADARTRRSTSSPGRRTRERTRAAASRCTS